MTFFVKTAVTLALFFGVQAAGRAQEPAATFTIDRTSHDFGTLARGEAGRTLFTVTNTGSEPLVLLEVRISCRCTRIDWPRRPIPPGGQAQLAVTYKDRQAGTFYKTAEIVTNGNPQRVSIRLQGSVAER